MTENCAVLSRYHAARRPAPSLKNVGTTTSAHPKAVTYGIVGYVMSTQRSTPSDCPPSAEVQAAMTEPKPTWRGWLHTGMTPVALLGGLILLVLTPSIEGRAAAAVYTLTMLALFGNSAVYHRGTWTERVRGVLKRVDHSNIYLFIAGTYTPLAVHLLDGPSRIVLLCLAWGLAAAGVTSYLVWPGAPRWLATSFYVAMGWVALFWLVQFWFAPGGVAVVILVAVGGLIYTYGALVYGRKRPNPAPKVFGFHEIFHACTVVAALCHYAAICVATFA